MRPHTLAVLVSFGYLRLDSSKYGFRVTFKAGDGFDWKGSYKTYICSVKSLSKNTAKIEVRLENGVQLLPYSRRVECVATLSSNDVIHDHVIRIDHPYHYRSIGEVINFHFDPEVYGFTGMFESNHDYWDRNFYTMNKAKYSNPSGLKIEAFKLDHTRTELEVYDFQVL